MALPPEFMQKNAARALREREKYDGLANKPLTAVGIARARDLSNGKDIPLETLKRIKSFISRHLPGLKKGSRDSQGRLNKKEIGLLAWGEDGSGRALAWATRNIERLQKK